MSEFTTHASLILTRLGPQNLLSFPIEIGGTVVFSSTIFLFGFLPLVLLCHFVARTIPARNAVLLCASLFFYAWGEQLLVLLLLGSIGANHLFGRVIEARRGQGSSLPVLAAAVFVNLALLGVFKYANFLADNINALLQPAGLPAIDLPPIQLPLGISFFTFQALTYVVDIYRGQATAQHSLFRTALYISLFPQLVAGPIVRYRTIAGRLARRFVTLQGFVVGSRRFVIGLAKKVLIADTLAVATDGIFAIPGDQLSLGLSWFGVICFSFQIYFDFSGYTDMAIGLGRMFGFKFPENFNYPYTAQSIRKFWRRWHMSLTTWFRDYLYIPLGGSQGSLGQTQINLLIVFILCGLWHGAAWTFLVWGLYHGAFLVLERTAVGQWVASLWRPLRHTYCLIVVMVGWVIFRADSLAHAGDYLAAMVGLRGGGTGEFHPGLYLNGAVGAALCAGFIGSTPLPRCLARALGQLMTRRDRPGHLLWQHGASLGSALLITALLVVCSASIVAGTYRPFLYFRF